jgi:hypothetical protein
MNEIKMQTVVNCTDFRKNAAMLWLYNFISQVILSPTTAVARSEERNTFSRSIIVIAGSIPTGGMLRTTPSPLPQDEEQSNFGAKERKK